MRDLPLYRPLFGNGADEVSVASSAKKAITASGSRLFQASSKARAARNLGPEFAVRDQVLYKARVAVQLEAAPRVREKRERASSMTRTTICLYLSSRGRRPCSSIWSIFSMKPSS